VVQSVRASWKSVTIEELAQGARVARVDPLVRIEGEDPIRPKLGRGSEQPVPVGPVVRTPVAAPSRIGKEDLDQWAGGEQVMGFIGAAVIERNDRVADPRRRVEVLGNVLGRVADREQADDAAAAAPPPVRSQDSNVGAVTLRRVASPVRQSRSSAENRSVSRFPRTGAVSVKVSIADHPLSFGRLPGLHW
jgi:hypothetical protein